MRERECKTVMDHMVLVFGGGCSTIGSLLQSYDWVSISLTINSNSKSTFNLLWNGGWHPKHQGVE